METFVYHGYEVPERLAVLTGGGGETFDAVATEQLAILQRLIPIEPEHQLLEIGCGIGKLAIPLANMLSPNGRYCGVDVIRDSIGWCQNNITPRHRNVEFIHVDAMSHMYNPEGGSQSAATRLPFPDGTIDRIFLFSVFTHMFEPDIRDYLSEFRRLLKPSGRILATWFVIDDAALAAVRKNGSSLGPHILFPYQISMGCYVNVIEAPLGAVGYTLPCIQGMMINSGLRISNTKWGYWSGARSNERDGGQDTTILELAGT